MDTKVELKELSEHFQCGICQGYIIDANTITECLHSFCKSCIFHFIESIDRSCPTCNHSLTDTDNCIKSDSSLQRLIYQLIPSLLENELERREAFQLQDRTNSESSLLNDDSLVSIQLKSALGKSEEAKNESTKENLNDNNNIFDSEADRKTDKLSVKYIQCVAQTPVRIISRMLRNKYNISLDYTINLSYMGHMINETETLLKVFTSFIKPKSEILVLHYDLIKSPKAKNPKLDVKKDLTSSINGISSLKIKNEEIKSTSKSALADKTKKLPLSIKTSEIPNELKPTTKPPESKPKEEQTKSTKIQTNNQSDASKKQSVTLSLSLQPSTLKIISKNNKKQDKSKVKKLEIKVKGPAINKSAIAKDLRIDEEIVVFKPSINSVPKETAEKNSQIKTNNTVLSTISLLKPAESKIDDAASVYYSDQDYDDDSEEGRLLIDVNNNNNYNHHNNNNDIKAAVDPDNDKATQSAVKNSVNNEIDSPLDLRVNQQI